MAYTVIPKINNTYLKINIYTRYYLTGRNNVQTSELRCWESCSKQHFLRPVDIFFMTNTTQYFKFQCNS